jgi:hypothetical protein
VVQGSSVVVKVAAADAAVSHRGNAAGTAAAIDVGHEGDRFAHGSAIGGGDRVGAFRGGVRTVDAASSVAILGARGRRDALVDDDVAARVSPITVSAAAAVATDAVNGHRGLPAALRVQSLEELSLLPTAAAGLGVAMEPRVIVSGDRVWSDGVWSDGVWSDASGAVVLGPWQPADGARDADGGTTQRSRSRASSTSSRPHSSRRHAASADDARQRELVVMAHTTMKEVTALLGADARDFGSREPSVSSSGSRAASRPRPWRCECVWRARCWVSLCLSWGSSRSAVWSSR